VYLVMKAHYKEKVGPNILVVEINSEVLDQLNRAKAWIEDGKRLVGAHAQGMVPLPKYATWYRSHPTRVIPIKSSTGPIYLRENGYVFARNAPPEDVEAAGIDQKVGREGLYRILTVMTLMRVLAPHRPAPTPAMAISAMAIQFIEFDGLNRKSAFSEAHVPIRKFFGEHHLEEIDWQQLLEQS